MHGSREILAPVGLTQDDAVQLQAVAFVEGIGGKAGRIDDAQARFELAQPAREFGAAHPAGHDDVGQEQFQIRLPNCDLQRGWSVGGVEYPEAHLLKVGHRNFKQIDLVVDDQHGFPSFHHRWQRSYRARRYAFFLCERQIEHHPGTMARFTVQI